MTRLSLSSLVAIGLLISACGAAAPFATNNPSEMPPPSSAPPSSTATAGRTGPRDIASTGDFAPLDPGVYYIEPVTDGSRPLRVVYTIPAEGWSSFIGAFKPGEDPRDQTVQINIAIVTNLVTEGCSDHSAQSPPVGPTVDDLATALAELAPFELIEEPADVTMAGYSGKHLVWTVPDTLVGTECQDAELKSWIAPPLSYAFYGYSPGLIEEFWILDVEGTRLMISAHRYADSSQADVDELQAVLDSIRIER
jgi:hypothetical protein